MIEALTITRIISFVFFTLGILPTAELFLRFLEERKRTKKTAREVNLSMIGLVGTHLGYTIVNSLLYLNLLSDRSINRLHYSGINAILSVLFYLSLHYLHRTLDQITKKK